MDYYVCLLFLDDTELREMYKHYHAFEYIFVLHRLTDIL